MRNSRLLAGIVITLAFFGLLTYLTLSAQAAECRVCVSYGGRDNCAVATAADKTEATRSAQTTACGTLAQGMNDKIACDNTPPRTKECHTK
jgi:hypothetical protein